VLPINFVPTVSLGPLRASWK